MSEEIILFDLPSKGTDPRAWSLNPWKARASLNFKDLPYKTEWIEYPDIAPTCKKLGIQPNDTSSGSSYAEYSSPFAKMPDGNYIMDSRKIAEALEKIKPEPSLHMDEGEMIDRTQATVLSVNVNLGAIGMPRVPEKLLNEKSAEYFYETRKKRFGMPLPDLAKSDRAKNAWENAAPHIQALADLLEEKKDGPYVLGKDPSFCDMIIGGFWVFVKKLDEGGDLFDKGMKMHDVFPRHYEAVKKWFEKDD